MATDITESHINDALGPNPTGRIGTCVDVCDQPDGADVSSLPATIDCGHGSLLIESAQDLLILQSVLEKRGMGLDISSDGYLDVWTRPA